MVTSRLLLLGGNGQIGKALQRLSYPEDWHLGVFTRAECDFMHPESIGKTIQNFAPDLVINAAAMTDIEACQQNPGQAREVNFHAVANIAGQCDTLSAPLIHLSSDYVFDGRDGVQAYAPDDAMNPVNVYGETKMMGEEAVRHGMYWHVILRTSLVFSADGQNVLTKALRQIDTMDEISAAQDLYTCPTSAAAVAESVATIATAIMNGKGNGFGTFHICSEPAVTRFEFLQAIMDAYAPYTDRRPRLVATTTDAPTLHTPRPPRTVLNCDKIRDFYGVTTRPWHEDLKTAVAAYAHQKATEPLR